MSLALSVQQPLVSPLNIFTSSPFTGSGTVAGVTGDYGLVNIPVSITAGNTLVCFIGWNSATMAKNPVSSVADDAHNFWIPLVTSSSAFTVRGSVWICPNAQAPSFISVATSLPTSGLVALVAELPGLPTLAQAGFTATSAGSNSATSLTTPSGSPSASVWAFSLAVSGNTTDMIGIPGSPWQPLGTVTVTDPAGAGGPADTVLTPMWGSFPAGSVSASFSSSSAQPMAAMLAGILQAPAPVTYKNPNWPAVKVEAAFGFQPGDPTQMPTWTDLTSRTMNSDGEVTIETSRGRAYELTSPEAGETTIWFDNHDGALTPLNSLSPYYPNVALEIPVRATATWNDRTYPLLNVRVDQWPQQWPERQWGMSPMAASDNIGVLANLIMNSAYQSEVLLDQPYGYWALGESYGSANGLPFGNLSFASQKVLLGLDGQTPSAVVPLQCGLSLDMQGDTGSGIGVNSQTSVAPRWSAGAICIDPGLPQVDGVGLTVEFWAATALPAAPNYVTPMVTLAGPPSNYPQGGGIIRFQAALTQTGTGPVFIPGLQTTVGDFLGGSFTDTGGNTVSDGNVHHHVYTVSFGSGNFTVTHYLDGALDHTFTSSGVVNSNDVYQLIVGAAVVNTQTLAAPNPFNYTIAHVAVYNHQLSAQRINAHYQAGALGFSGDTNFQRFKRIMAWGQSGIPKAADAGSPSPLLGVADLLQGQDTSSALYDVTTSEGGMVYADAAGNVWYQSRVYQYDRQPKWVFSDNPTGSQVPYDPSASFDYDNKYLFTQVLVQRQIGVNNTVSTDPVKGALILHFENDGAQITATDTVAEAKYFRRNSLSQTIQTTSDADVYDRANWSLNKYRQPVFRVPSIVLNPSSNPSIWPVALGVEQGDVVQVLRNPLGSVPYSVTGLVQKIEHSIGPDKWQVTLSISPLSIESNVLLVGTGPNSTLAEGIGW